MTYAMYRKIITHVMHQIFTLQFFVESRRFVLSNWGSEAKRRPVSPLKARLWDILTDFSDWNWKVVWEGSLGQSAQFSAFTESHVFVFLKWQIDFYLEFVRNKGTWKWNSIFSNSKKQLMFLQNLLSEQYQEAIKRNYQLPQISEGILVVPKN